MTSVVIDGIRTEFDVIGAGPPILMFSPGGFDATMAKWSTQGVYREIRPVEHLSERYSCIVFDRRESGRSGGRVEPLTWQRYADQGRGLLAHLGIERAHVMGACMGAPPALTLAVGHPELVAGLIQYWPVGGARYRIRGQDRFAQHLTFARERGLGGVADLALGGTASFGEDPRVGPWASVLRNDASFRSSYRSIDPSRYEAVIDGTVRTLFDRDTAHGAEPEELIRAATATLIVPGADHSHATSAARFLDECLPSSEYWDEPVARQTEAAAAERLFAFLGSVPSP